LTQPSKTPSPAKVSTEDLEGAGELSKFDTNDDDPAPYGTFVREAQIGVNLCYFDNGVLTSVTSDDKTVYSNFQQIGESCGEKK